MIQKSQLEKSDYKTKDIIRLISKTGEFGYTGRPLSHLLFFYNSLMEYYDGISVVFRALNIRHPEHVAMYIYIETSRIQWITREMLEHPAFSEDALLRLVSPFLKELNASYINDNKADFSYGKISCQSVDSSVCRRSGLLYDKEADAFVLKLKLVFPTGSGSTISGSKMARFLKDILKLVDEKTAFGDKEDTEKRFHVYLRQQQIRKWCKDHGYVTFIADGSILPRRGDTEEPSLTAIPFSSPEKYRVCIPLDDEDNITGMGLKRGVTVITGAGFSGKTTLLEAIDAGIFDHIPGDGREYVLSDRTAFVANAEDGRYVHGVDMSSFFLKIPGQDCHNFSTTDASGSVSQAANIIEAVQVGARLCLIDEDKSATNFMICDSKIRRLVPDEIIIPFTDRIDELVKTKNVSFIIVIGGSSEYFRYADHILVMRDYQPHSIDAEIEKELRSEPKHQRDLPPIAFSDKYYNMSETDMTKLLFRTVNAEKIKKVFVGQCSADVSALTSIKDDDQLHGLAMGVYKTMALSKAENKSIYALVEDGMEQFWDDLTNEGCTYEGMFRQWFVSDVRPIDVMLTINRMRGFEFRIATDSL